MIKQVLALAIASGMLISSAISIAAEDAATQPQPSPITFNPVDPVTFMGFINPATHKEFHAAAANPAQWSQFMQPQFFMQMADPSKMAGWMNPMAYQVMMNPATYMYWMQPDNLMNEMGSAPMATFMNPGSYAAFMNPAAYTAWMNPAAYTGGAAQLAGNASAQNWFDMNAWTNMFQPVQPKATDEDS